MARYLSALSCRPGYNAWVKFADLPVGAKYFDVDGIPVVEPSPGAACIAFSAGRPDADSHDFPNHAKATQQGDALTHDEFAVWLRTGKNRFDTV